MNFARIWQTLGLETQDAGQRALTLLGWLFLLVLSATICMWLYYFALSRKRKLSDEEGNAPTARPSACGPSSAWSAGTTARATNPSCSEQKRLARAMLRDSEYKSDHFTFFQEIKFIYRG